MDVYRGKAITDWWTAQYLVSAIVCLLTETGGKNDEEFGGLANSLAICTI